MSRKSKNLPSEKAYQPAAHTPKLEAVFVVVLDGWERDLYLKDITGWRITPTGSLAMKDIDDKDIAYYPKDQFKYLKTETVDLGLGVNRLSGNSADKEEIAD